jgi:hypothetical protein
MAMINAPHRGDGRRGQSTAALQRDAALLRISRTRRWLIAAAAAGSAGVAALVSSVAPGHTLGSKSKAGSLRATAGAGASSAAASGGAVSNKMPPLASAAALGLQGPSSAPQSSSDPSQSGGSAQSAPDPSQAASDPAQAAPVPAPAPAPAPAVSGGS